VFKRLGRRLRALVGGGALDRQMDQELRFHLDLETNRLEQQGLTPEEARTRAVRVFGGVEKVREECRDARRTSWVETLVRNSRYAWRALRRQPGYVTAVVVTLGLGIGANTAMFSVIDGVLLKPLPYPGSDRLVLIQESAPLAGQDSVGVSIRELYDYREQLKDFDGIVEFHAMSFDLINRGEPDRVNAGVVSSNFFDVLRVRPVIGRTFLASDEGHGAEAVLVLSYDYWQTRFGGDPKIVGQVFEMNDRPHTVVGVLPPMAQYPQDCDVYMPSSACPFRADGEKRMAAGNRRAFGALTVFGRLKPGISAERAAADVAMVGNRFNRDYATVYTAGDGFRAGAVPLLQEITRNARPMLLMILGATLLVLLLACANVASLTLARTLHRERELALRIALGAGRGQLAGQLLTETVMLALVGGALGLLIARLMLGGLTVFIGRFTARTGDIAIDATVLIFTLVLSVLTGLAFGALPALVARPGPAAALKQAGPASAGSPRRRRLQSTLVVAQVAVSVVLLVGAGLFLTSFYRLQRVDAGYKPDRVLSAEVFGNFTRFKTADDFRRLYLPIVERLERVPGIVSASVASVVPLGSEQMYMDAPVRIEGRPPNPTGQGPTSGITIATGNYFDTLQIAIVSGRGFQSTDTMESQRVALVNKAMARSWGTRDPIGTRLSIDNGETWMTVVGVTANVRQFSLEREPESQIYLPLTQSPMGLPGRVIVRTQGDEQVMSQVIRAVVHDVDPNVPVKNISTLDELRSQYLARPRLTALLLFLFAGVALVVTLTGLAGVMATSVSQRTQEFGVRLALGARPAALVRGVLRQGTALLLVGLLIGIVSASAAGRVLTTYLFHTAPTDPLTFVGVAAALLVTGLLACLGPARRATSVDPLQALRSE
jgi:predicted permease